MIKLSKPYFYVMLLQAVCLVIGLWIHHRFIVSSASIETERQVWKDLSDWSHDWISGIRQLPLNDLQQVQEQLASVSQSRETSILLVDSNWRIKLPEISSERKPGTDFPTWKTGQKIEWTELSTLSNSAEDSNRGTLETTNGIRLGLAYELKNGNGYAIGYRPAELPPHNPETLLSMLPAAGGLAFLWTCGLQCVVAYLILSRVHVEDSRQRKITEESTLKNTKTLVRTRDAIIFGLAKLAESRDTATGQHLERISLYSTRLAAAMKKHPKFREVVTPTFVKLIGISSALHDIGKVGIEDSILFKPGRLTQEERLRMQKHAAIGGECIRQIERRLANSNFLQLAREIALFHHEHWDGNGYPHGISREQIPLSARIVAVADVFDALASKRVYKDSWPHEKCVETIRNEAGKQFDADIVEVFLQVESKFREIRNQYTDAEEAEETISKMDSEVEFTEDRNKSEQTLTTEQEQALLQVLPPNEDF